MAVLCWGQGGTGPPNLAQAPKFLIGSIVISLSRCCFPNDEGPAPPPVVFPRTATGHWCSSLNEIVENVLLFVDERGTVSSKV